MLRGDDVVGRLLDTLDPSVLENALHRRQCANSSTNDESPFSTTAPAIEDTSPQNAVQKEGNGVTQQTDKSASLVSDADLFVTDSVPHLLGPPVETQVADGMELPSIPDDTPDHTLFFSDTFDPSLGSWLTDGLIHSQNFDMIGGVIPDFSMPGSQYSMPANPFAFLPNMRPDLIAEKIKSYTVPAPADVVDEMYVH